MAQLLDQREHLSDTLLYIVARLSRHHDIGVVLAWGTD
jgi:hypothetical protein